MLEKYKKFLLIFIAFILSASIIYAGSFIWANTLENGTGGYYLTKNFLLENTKDRPRIIFDGGSSTQHSINSLMIENELNKTTLNMGYNAGYPLDFRLHRLEHFLNSEDIVVLPLEYPYYSRDEKAMISIIANELVSYGKFHFNALPLNKKLLVITKLNFTQATKPFKNAYRIAKHKFIGSSFNFDEKVELTQLLNSGERGDINYTALLRQGIDLHKIDHNNGATCQEYIAVDKISSYFINNLELIKQIQARTGAKFIFAYPALAGKNCLDFNTAMGKKIKDLIDQSKNLMIANGFEILGKPEESYFPNNMLDTYWHIDEKARDIRTKRLIKELQKTNIFNSSAKRELPKG